jgi:rod shape-determining protein MreB
MLRPKRVAIDMGSTRTRVYDEGKGVIFSEPTVIARDEASLKTLALGQEALDMSGRMPEGIDIVWPLRSGVIADYKATTELFNHVMRQTLGRMRLIKPEAIISVSSSATSTEKRALIDAAKEAGFQQVYLIKSPVAAAIGSGLPIHEPRGNIIVDIGGGTTEIAVLSLGGIVTEYAIRFGSNTFDDAILRCIRREHGMIIGSEELMRIKHDFSALSQESGKTLHIHGQDLVQGLPKTSTLNLRQLQPYLHAALEKIELAIRRVLEQAPPDLLSDSIKHGIMLSGGGSLLRGLDAHFSKRFKVAFVRAEMPKVVVAKGVQGASKHIDEYRRSLIS